jgi:hypothetical protein
MLQDRPIKMTCTDTAFPSPSLYPPYLSAQLLGLPRSRLRLRGWLVIAVATGILLALIVFAVGNLIF